MRFAMFRPIPDADNAAVGKYEMICIAAGSFPAAIFFSEVVKMTQKQFYLKRLALCSVMIALATGLSLIKVWQMPLGGSVTLLSMLPIIMLAYFLDIKWALASAFVYSLIQLALGIMTEGVLAWGLTPMSLAGTFFLDYIVPFTLLGFAGVFSKKETTGLCFGTVFVMVARFICHFVSGIIIFDIWCPWKNVWIYSLCYNGAFMLPELIITTIAVFLLGKSGVLNRIKKLVER